MAFEADRNSFAQKIIENAPRRCENCLKVHEAATEVADLAQEEGISEFTAKDIFRVVIKRRCRGQDSEPKCAYKPRSSHGGNSGDIAEAIREDFEETYETYRSMNSI